ncbi:hypothetical protein D0B83_11520 [Vibrio cholerae]|nr:hypothetical protein [Vibrio cholerae]EGR2244115.1 hypothetical protein [Vibrio cholerae]
MSYFKSGFYKVLEVHIKSSKEFCYFIWLIFSSDKLLGFYFMRFNQSEMDFTIKNPLLGLIKENVKDIQIPKYSPKTHGERCDDILIFLKKFKEFISNNIDNKIISTHDLEYFLIFIRKTYISEISNERFNWLTPRDRKLCLWTYKYLLKVGIVNESKFYDNEEMALYCTAGFKLWNASEEEKNKRYKKLILARNEKNHRDKKSNSSKYSKSKKSKYVDNDTYNTILSIVNSGEIDIDSIQSAIINLSQSTMNSKC